MNIITKEKILEIYDLRKNTNKTIVNVQDVLREKFGSSLNLTTFNKYDPRRNINAEKNIKELKELMNNEHSTSESHTNLINTIKNMYDLFLKNYTNFENITESEIALIQKVEKLLESGEN